MRFGRLKIVSAIIVVCLSGFGSLAQAHDATAKFLVVPDSPAQLKEIGQKFSIEGREGDGFFVFVPAQSRADLLRIAPQAQLVDKDITATQLRWEAEHRDVSSKLFSFSTVESHLNDIVNAHPEITRLDVYGQSTDGRKLMALKIAKNAAQDSNLPEIMITGATHGNEILTVEVVMGLIDRMIAGYGTDDRITRMVDTHQIYYIPVVSPDSYTDRTREVDGVDPNREYPWPDQPSRNPTSVIKKEMAFVDAHKFVASIDYHSQASLIMYPWAYTDEPVSSADARTFEEVAQTMSDANGYGTGQISQIMYIAVGSSADYYYWKHKTIAFGIELSSWDKSPNFSIKGVVDENVESTWRMIEHF